ncbi:MAG TPA: ABC transporter permease [Vicinamibacterales bacterium]|nr:ABC transporter permease [Vicinamibacterales bacterium]
MSLASRLGSGFAALLRRRRVETELDEELRGYIDAAVEEHVRRGLAPKAARRAALAEFGSIEAVKDYTRDSGWEARVEGVWTDIKYAVRGFRRTPAFTTAAVVTLALGIGGTTAIFSVVDALFLRAPDGVRDAARVRKIFVARDSGSIQTGVGGPGSWVDYATIRDHVPAFSRVAASRGPALMDLGRGAAAEQIRGEVVSHEYFDVLGLRPALGRFFVAQEDGARGATPVAVISYGMWQSRFGGRHDVLGKPILVDGDLLDIVGVTERGFTGINEDVVDVWVPSSVPRNESWEIGDWRFSAESIFAHYVARLAPGATDAAAVSQATSALTVAAKATPAIDQTPSIATTAITLAAAPYSTPAGNLSLWLSLVAGLVLIVACANVANLLVARGLTRRREIALRLAIGAGRWRVIRQHLIESTVLALAGGLAGLAFARLTMVWMREFPVPPSAGRIDERLLVFALLVSVVTGALFGLLPAWHAVSSDPVEELKTSRMIAGPARHWTRSTLVALQLSLSLVLLVGAALFVRSVLRVTNIQAGIDINRLLVAEVDLSRVQGESVSAGAFYDMALARIARVPGVESAALVHLTPFNGASTMSGWKIAGRRDRNGREVQGAMPNAVGAGYFRTAGTRIVAGREFEASDASGAPVAIVDERLARLMADDGRVIGKCVAFGRQIRNGGCTTIVGIAEPQRHRFIDADAPARVFFSWAQAPNAIPFGTPSLIVRTHATPSASIVAVRNALQGLRADLPYVSVKPLAENIRRDLIPFQLGATLFSLFGVLALLVSGVGLYGMLGYFVAERTAEIGVRRSLGASVMTVVVMVCRQSAVPVAAGLLAGLAISAGGTRYLASLLFGIEPRDALSFAAAVVFLVVTAAIATLLPAWRAVCVEPMVALRHE